VADLDAWGVISAAAATVISAFLYSRAGRKGPEDNDEDERPVVTTGQPVGLDRVEELARRATLAEGRLEAEKARADEEAKKRRILEEYASALRRDLMTLGGDPDTLRRWPEY